LVDIRSVIENIVTHTRLKPSREVNDNPKTHCTPTTKSIGCSLRSLNGRRNHDRSQSSVYHLHARRVSTPGVKHWTLGESLGTHPGFSMYVCQMSHTSTGGVIKNPSAVARSRSHRRNLQPSTIQWINIKRRARPSQNGNTDLSTAISRNHSHLPFAPIDLPMGGKTSFTPGSEYGSSTFSWKSLKALSNLK